MKRLIILVMLAIVPTLASANVTLQSWNTKMSPQEKQIYIAGVASGYEWSNAFLSQEGKAPHYCVPSNLALNPQNFMSIFEDQLKAQSYKPEDRVEIILMFGLKRTFPCK